MLAIDAERKTPEKRPFAATAIGRPGMESPTMDRSFHNLSEERAERLQERGLAALLDTERVIGDGADRPADHFL